MTKPEAQTRIELIDKRLAEAGWNVKDPTQVAEEFFILKSANDSVAEPRTPFESHEFGDYALLGKDGKALAVVEAKKSNQDATIGREQAKQYCANKCPAPKVRSNGKRNATSLTYNRFCFSVES